jgi:heptosyltransferase II
MSKSSKRQRILVMRYRFIGDTLLAVPFLRQLHKAYPDAQIDLLAAPNSGELLENCPYLSRIIYFDTTRKHRYENTAQADKPQSLWSYAGRLRKTKYDTAFVLKRSLSSAALAFMAGIPERIGFDTEGRGFLLTKRVPYQQKRHEIDCFLDVLAAANIEVNRRDCRLEAWPNPADKYKVLEIFHSYQHAPETKLIPPRKQRHFCLHLTSSNPSKEWSIKEAAKVAEWLLGHEEYHIHCFGATSDKVVYETLRAHLFKHQQPRIYNHCGKFTITESMAFLKHMNLVVGVDSGALHMAAAANVPILALFGPQSPIKWAPPGAEVISSLGTGCSACQKSYPCEQHQHFLQSLRAETVIETINRMLTLIPDQS